MHNRHSVNYVDCYEFARYEAMLEKSKFRQDKAEHLKTLSGRAAENSDRNHAVLRGWYVPGKL